VINDLAPNKFLSNTDSEMVRLLEADKAEATGFLRGVLATAVAIRTAGFTAWLTLLGFSIQQELPGLAVLAVLVIVTFGVVDAYHGWLYSQAFWRVRQVEEILGRYYTALGQAADDPDALDDFRADLYAHRFGTYNGFEKFRVNSLASARPLPLYHYLYPTLTGAAVLVGVLVAASS
jgi:hypothetical protein